MLFFIFNTEVLQYNMHIIKLKKITLGGLY